MVDPNIQPREEYEIRKEENKRYATELGVPFVDADYDVDNWYERAEGMEWCPERGTRCSMCFDMRMERTALHAHEHGFSHFTTTNATSRWKDEAQVNASGVRAAARYAAGRSGDNNSKGDGVEHQHQHQQHQHPQPPSGGGPKYWLYDWQTDAMTRRKYEINADMRFYKQEYCGCSYSLRDTNSFRRSQGQPPIRLPSSAVYDDPERDCAEESVEVVESFFAHDLSDERMEKRRLREIYRQRRKDGTAAHGQGSNNW